MKTAALEPPSYRRGEMPGNLTPFHDALKQALKVEAHRPSLPPLRHPQPIPDERLSDDRSFGRRDREVAPRKPVALGDADVGPHLQGTEAPALVDFWSA
jgi:hypothetical protein